VKRCKRAAEGSIGSIAGVDLEDLREREQHFFLF